jgi:uncharacterized membrane-anchored protein
MQPIHLPKLGPRYWVALCLASIFGANMGDLFARNLGLGHVAGLPFLAVALAMVILAERFDRTQHESYYWIGVIIVRTAATNFADFAAGDLKLPRVWVMGALTILLIAAVWFGWQFAWRWLAKETDDLLRANFGYWVCMFIAGTLGTVIGDYWHVQRCLRAAFMIDDRMQNIGARKTQAARIRPSPTRPRRSRSSWRWLWPSRRRASARHCASGHRWPKSRSWIRASPGC